MRQIFAPLAIVAALAAVLHAQNAPGTTKGTPARRPTARVAPFGPQPGVTGTRNPTDLKTVLYYAADALGMLRGPREVDGPDQRPRRRDGNESTADPVDLKQHVLEEVESDWAEAWGQGSCG